MSTVSILTVAQAIPEIDAHITKCGGGYAGWYCGIASDPRKRLFTDHRVDEKDGSWIYRDLGTDTSARRVEDHFINKGYKGGGGGGDRATRFAYAYKITWSTRESG